MGHPPKVIALVFPPHEQYGREVIDGIIESVAPKYHWQMIDLPHQRVGRSPLPRGGLALDGALVWSDAQIDEWLDGLAATGIPIVNCGRGWLGHPRISNITVDSTTAQQPLYEHFRTLGLQHIVAAGYRLDKNPAARKAMEDLVANANAYGMTGQVFDIGGAKDPAESPRRIYEPGREKALLDLLGGLPSSSGMICASDYIGALACNVARLRGLRVPHDLAIACFGNNLVARIATPPLTSITSDGRQVGRAASKLLAKLFADGGGGAENVELGGKIYKLHIRESTVGASMAVTMERARRFIETNAITGISMKDLRRITGLSTNTLVSNYRKAFGIPPVEAMHGRRIGEAKRLLRETALPVTIIATRCGFNSAPSFYNYFLRHTGVIPSAWRNAPGEI